MTERKLKPYRLWPLPVMAAIAAYEFYEANQQPRELDWVLLSILGAVAMFVIIVRGLMKV